MSSKKIIISVLSIFLVGGCASGPEWTQISEKDIKPMTYDYNIPNTNKDVLFKRARNHFATVYGDSRSVIRVQDEAEGLIIGKGAIDWKLGTDTLAPISCSSSYNRGRFRIRKLKHVKRSDTQQLRGFAQAANP